jgi:tetratricopeptide (TPR) repeat protein
LKKIEEPNYYQLLNIQPEADVSEIIYAYHELCKKFSIFPYASEEELNRINSDFVVYKKAYMVLTSAPERKKYDEFLKDETASRKITSPETEDDVYLKSISNTSDLEELLFLNNAPKLNNNDSDFTKMKIDITNNMFEKAVNYLENEKFHEAINMFRKLIDINDNEARYHSYLGLALLKKGWDNYAQEEFKIALHQNSEDEIALEHYKEPQYTSKLNTRVTSLLDPEKAQQGIIYRVINFIGRVFPNSPIA